MIAAACLASKLPPTAFGVDLEDVPAVADQMLFLLQKEGERTRAEALKAKLRGAGR